MAGRQLSIESCTASTEVSPTHTAQKAINGDGLTFWDSGPLVEGSDVLLPITITLKLEVKAPTLTALPQPLSATPATRSPNAQ